MRFVNRVREDVAYILPMAIFLLLMQAGNTWPGLYPHAYVARALLVPVALVLLWRRYTPPRWNHWWLGAIVGVIGIVQWLGMQLWLQQHFEFFRPSGDAFNPAEYFKTSPALFYAFIAVRIFGAVLAVPVMEELFWRDFLWRSLIAPSDFKLAAVGEWDPKAFFIVAGAFALVHGNWWLTAIGWGLLVGLLLVYTRSLGACIIAHAVTNLLLAVYVLYTGDWSFW